MGPIVDPFRPPPHPGAAGNRGIDYETVPGHPVGAAADGEVVFAGPVGGSLHVVVLHADGIRTSYSFLQSIAVHRGDKVVQGQLLATSGARLHFGARAGDTYIDPTRLFAAGPPEVHLVPDDERQPASEDHERSGLLAGLRDLAGSVAGSTADAVAWARDRTADASDEAARQAWESLGRQIEELGGVITYMRDLDPAVFVSRQVETLAAWKAQRDHCTPPETTPEPLRPGERLAVKVGGFGSSSEPVGMIKPDEGVAIDHLDTAALGYRPDDVVRFSYAGGTIAENTYDGPDSAQDIRISARRLRQLLQRLGEQHPGVPIDILAHSQGSLVARQALALEADPGDGELPRITTLVLFGAPNTGTDLATGAVMLAHSRSGAMAERLVGVARPDKGPIDGSSMHQMAETSMWLARLNHTPLPSGVHVTSIGARTDPVVPALHTRLQGADNVIVDSGGGIHTHDNLPGSPAAQREAALALRGLPPTCQTLADMMDDTAVAQGIGAVDDLAGVGAWAEGHWVDSVSPSFPHIPVFYGRR
ncbi:MAG: M23 family metallopeptidase [Actinomycetota bacterium]|nr:M23 family metallopeptidase [Actinomycetota bacterium]